MFYAKHKKNVNIKEKLYKKKKDFHKWCKKPTNTFSNLTFNMTAVKHMIQSAPFHNKSFNSSAKKHISLHLISFKS